MNTKYLAAFHLRGLTVIVILTWWLCAMIILYLHEYNAVGEFEWIEIHVVIAIIAQVSYA